MKLQTPKSKSQRNSKIQISNDGRAMSGDSFTLRVLSRIFFGSLTHLWSLKFGIGGFVAGAA